MAVAKKQDIPAANRCEFCKKTFVKESTLISHSCEMKRRWLWKDEKYIRIGLLAFQKFYQISMRIKKPKSYDDFMERQYFTSFTGFGRYLLDINAIEPEGFIEFLIREGVKLQAWKDEAWYETWVRELAKKETPQKAVERNILLMEAWARDTGEPWQDFFRKVPPSLATKWIRTGRISPWLLYTNAGSNLFERMSDEQLLMIKDWINPLYWSDKVKRHKSDMDFIKMVLKEAGV
jgi:hypothetical protein